MSITLRGTEWLTAAEVATLLGGDITPDVCRDWKRRGLIRGTVLAGTAHYRRDDVVEAEMLTRLTPTGRPRAA